MYFSRSDQTRDPHSDVLDQPVELSRRVSRRANAPDASEPDQLVVAYRSPVAIMCCRSAAAVHDLSDELPPAVQIAVP